MRFPLPVSMLVAVWMMMSCCNGQQISPSSSAAAMEGRLLYCDLHLIIEKYNSVSHSSIYQFLQRSKISKSLSFHSRGSDVPLLRFQGSGAVVPFLWRAIAGAVLTLRPLYSQVAMVAHLSPFSAAIPMVYFYIMLQHPTLFTLC